MSETYTKLFTSITVSTIWQEPMETRLTWITMLAMADQNGDVYASIPGLARMANVPMDKVEAALACLLAPDPYSRSKENDGRRVEEIDGGWRLLNHSKFHAIRMEAERAAYKREWDRQHRPSGAARANSSTSPTKSDSSPTKSDTPTISDRPDPPDQTKLLPEEKPKSKDLSSSVGSRLPIDWVCPPDWMLWARRERDDIDHGKEALKFADYWHGIPGAKGRKSDWLGTWRNWIRGADSNRRNRSNGTTSAAASFHNKRYTGTAESDLPEDLRPKSEAM